MTMMASASDGPYLRACALSGFARIAKSKGGDPVAMLERAGIDPNVLSAPEMLISFAGFSTLLEQAALSLDAVTFGLEWAANIAPHFPNAGPLLLLREDAATCMDWIGRWAGYWRPEISGIAFRLESDDDSGLAVLGVEPDRETGLARQSAEYVFGTIVRLARAALPDGGAHPARVRFSHARPRDTDLHDRLFGCPVEFDAERCEILFDKALLAGPLRDNAAALAPTMDQFLQHQIGLLPRYNPSVSTSTALAIRTVLGAGICSKDFIARSLRTSPRKLQRLLTQESTTYEDILDTVRKSTACQLLTETPAPISTIAGMLEFASSAAMTLAVRRWTGMTPSAFRANPHAADQMPDAGASPHAGPEAQVLLKPGPAQA